MLGGTKILNRIASRVGTGAARIVASLRSPEPVAIGFTLGFATTVRAAAAPPPYYIGDRPRLATCGGVAWFHGRHLATANLLGNAVHAYEFDPRRNTLELKQSLDQMCGLALPENLAFSPDGRLLAVTNSIDSTMNLYRVDLATHAIELTPVASIKPAEPVSPHGVSFSPCSGMLLYSTVETPGGLRCFRIIRGDGNGIEIVPTHELANRHAPLKPKGVAFSPDARFIALAYGPNAEASPCEERKGFLAIHAFDATIGWSREPIHTAGERLGLRCAEDVNFFPDGRNLVVTDQAADTASIIAFDSKTGVIGERRLTIQNPWGRLSFPHGNAVSPDGTHLAVANYGDDKVTIYKMPL